MAREGSTGANQRWLSRALWLLLVVFGVSALAYFVAPSAFQPVSNSARIKG